MVNTPQPREKYQSHLNKLDGACAFCSMGVALNIREYELWTWVYAAFPYRKYHTLVVPKRHIVTFSDLDQAELAELKVVLKGAATVYAETGLVKEGSLFGDQLYLSWRERGVTESNTKRSVSHFHIHLYPKFAAEAEVELDQHASEIDMTLMQNAAK